EFLSNYAYVYLQNELLKIDGVGKVQIMGAGKYSMRVWLNPERMAFYNLSVSDIASAIESQAELFSAGKLGAEPLANPTDFTYTVTTPSALSDPTEYEQIPLRVLPNGQTLRLGEVARVELGCQTYGASSSFGDKPASLIAIYQTPGSNAVEVGHNVKSQMTTLADRFPEGVEVATIVDATVTIEEGISEIFLTMGFTLLLVVLVIFVFLQDLRAVLIPLVAVPVSIIGAFMLFPLLGFSVNIISLLGLVLAIGLVVDDAIVVVEAAQVGIERGLTARQATLEAMRHVSSPIIATTVVLLAVFVPAAMIEGITGRMFQQFAIGISVSVVISAFNALTLSPALCSLLLRAKERPTKGPLGWFNRIFGRASEHYLSGTKVMVRHSVRSLLLVLITGGATLWFFHSLPSGFLTTEDQGYLMVSVSLPDAASVGRTEASIAAAQGAIEQIEGVEYVASTAGFDLISGVASTNKGVMFVALEPYSKRTLSATEIADRINATISAAVPDGVFYAFEPPSIPGLGVTSGITFVLQNRGSGDVGYLAEQTKLFVDKAQALPEIASVSTPFNAGVPQRKVEINEALALQQGVSLEELRTTLSTFLGGSYVGNFNRFGQLYQTYIQADAEYRRSESDLSLYYVNNSRGESVPVSSFVSLKDTVGVEYLTQFNLYDAISVNATPKSGVSSGSAMSALEKLASEELPDDVALAWSGVSYQEANAEGGAGTYLLAIALVFLALAALYNSWSLPMSVLLGVPLALFGSMLFLWLGHLLNPMFIDNIFARISLIMLIGISAKNAILVVEYADRLFIEEEHTLGEAALGAAKLRLRPILMTAFAFIIGVLPLVFASGAYSVARNTIGVSLVGGMLAATLLGIFVYPSLYYLVGRIARFERRREKIKQTAKL
ncbi:MAG: efflux RND transporter permease subunit, partial [Tidjanibacter sp.]|nr:efflux RND transporter permease subunit [Tidjanibacter sp.]